MAKLVFFTVAIVFSCSIALAEVPPFPSEAKSPSEIGQELPKKTNSQRPTVPAKSAAATHPLQAADIEKQYVAYVQALMVRQAFGELERAADLARANKDRLPGGSWKLYKLYDTVAMPPSQDQATEAEWRNRLTLLQKWATAHSQSITARIALAQVYYAYAWATRGSSYAADVAEPAWQLFRQRLEQAHATLDDAAKLSAKCPHWYFLMLEIARNEGWEQDQMRALFDRAIAFEPAYYHYYREFALNLFPKWNGNSGDAELFAEKSYQQIGGKQGAFVYFEIASLIYCPCSGASTSEHPHRGLSWPKIQEGFAIMEEQYGVTTTKLNRYAFIAYVYMDRGVANRMLVRIGDDWDHSVWRERRVFDIARSWAGLAAGVSTVRQ